MLSKKPCLFLSTYSSLQSLCQPPAASSTSSRLPTRPPTNHARTRTYATIAGDGHTSSHHGEHQKQESAIDHNWPSANHLRDSPPTPYQILNCTRNTPYSKRRYYELVKIYHPDRTSNNDGVYPHLANVPHAVRIERYRLIVAAHAILSDPTKRRAYDQSGSGWTGSASTSASYSGPSYHDWQKSDVMMNATWEDWERWYHKQNPHADKEPQTPIFLSNGAFVSLIVVIAALGGVGQATRAGQYGETLLERRDYVHNKTSAELRRIHEATRSTGGRAESVDAFLRHRDATTHAEEAWRRYIPVERETCASGDVQSR